jgi:hypothetical protein
MALVSHGFGEYHLEGESIIWTGRVFTGWRVYQLDEESIFWIGRVSSGWV